MGMSEIILRHPFFRDFGGFHILRNTFCEIIFHIL